MDWKYFVEYVHQRKYADARVTNSIDYLADFWDIKDEIVKPGSARSVIKGMVVILTDIAMGKKTAEESQKSYFSFLRRTVNLIEQKKNYKLFVEILNAAAVVSHIAKSQNARNAITHDLSLIYLALGKPKHLLVGIEQGKPIWKKDFDMPAARNWTAWEDIARHMIFCMPLINRDRAVILPEKFMMHHEIMKIQIPILEGDIKEILESAYYNQRFSPLETGVVVELEGVYDIQRLILFEVHDNLVARVETTYGVTMAVLELNVIEGFYFNEKNKDAMFLLLAQIYHDLVVPEIIEIDGSDDDSPSTRITRKVIDYGEPIRYRYLPRKVWKRRAKSRSTVVGIRRGYQGPRRPSRPHDVPGFRRKGMMTEAHYNELLKWEKDTGFRVPWQKVLGDPDWEATQTPSLEVVQDCGHTYVRPHFRPVSEEQLRKLPTFIHRRLQEKINEDV